MNYLSHYIEKAQTTIFDEMGAFFAFSNAQFDEQKVEGVTYTRLGDYGLICPKGKGAALLEALEAVHKAGMAQDIKENGKKGIIHRELANHEAGYTGDIDSTVDALASYPITADEIQAEFADFMSISAEDNHI